MNDMNNYEQFEGYLPGSDEAEMNGLLDELGRVDRDSAPLGLESGVLDAVGRAMAPAPLPLVRSAPRRFPAIAKLAVAAAVLCAASVGVVMMRPSASISPNVVGVRGEMLAVSLEADVESLLALDELEHEHELDESVAAWTLQAHALDSDLNSAWVALDLMDSSMDENGAL